MSVSEGSSLTRSSQSWSWSKESLSVSPSPEDTFSGINLDDTFSALESYPKELEVFPWMHFPSSILCQLWHHHIRPGDLYSAQGATLLPPLEPQSEYKPPTLHYHRHHQHLQLQLQHHNGYHYYLQYIKVHLNYLLIFLKLVGKLPKFILELVQFNVLHVEVVLKMRCYRCDDDDQDDNDADD